MIKKKIKKTKKLIAVVVMNNNKYDMSIFPRLYISLNSYK